MFSIEKRDERGEELQSWWYKQPEIGEPWLWILEAWEELKTERYMGFGAVGPIPSSAITEYAKLMELDNYEIGVFRYLIRKMDDLVLKRQEARIAATEK